MANSDNPNGFTPVRHMSGGTIRANGYLIESGETTAIFSGDLVTLETDGYIEQADATDVNIVGVFGGVEYTATDGSVVFKNNWVASTATLGSNDVKAYVYDDPSIVYSAQHDGTMTTAMNGSAFDVVVAAGSATSGRSSMEVDTSSASATSGQLKQVGLINKTGNATGANAEVEVIINEHLLKQVVAI